LLKKGSFKVEVMAETSRIALTAEILSKRVVLFQYLVFMRDLLLGGTLLEIT